MAMTQQKHTAFIAGELLVGYVWMENIRARLKPGTGRTMAEPCAISEVRLHQALHDRLGKVMQAVSFLRFMEW